MRYQIICGNCGKEAVKTSSDGIRPQYCSRDCYNMKNRELGKQSRKSADYWTLHTFVRKDRGRAGAQDCQHCGKPARDWAYIHDTDPRDTGNYMPLCRGCHVRYDLTDQTREKFRDLMVGRQRNELGQFLPS